MMVSAKRGILIPVFLIISIVTGFGQKDFKKDADQKFENGSYFSAKELYKKAYSATRKPSEKAKIIFQIAECYRKTNNDEQAEVWFRKAIKAQYDDPIAILRLAEALKRQGKYEEALSEFKNYKEKKPNDPRAEDGIKSCELSRKWMEESTRLEVEAEVLVNSKKRDFAPVISDRRGSAIIFTSSRDESTGEKVSKIYGDNYEDLYTAEMDRNGKWSVPENLGPKVNSKHHEGAAALSSRMRTMYFTRCYNMEDKKKEEKKAPCDIFISEKSGRDWGEAKVFEVVRPEGNDSSTIGHPTLGFRDEVMIFAADLPGGQGGTDLWMIRKEGRGTRAKWLEPKNLGEDVNTSGDEQYPFIHEDGSLYFASNGHLGMGGMDIFKAEQTGNPDEDKYSWGNVKNMKHPLNSPGDDFGIVYDGDENKGFFTSDRKGGRGKDDIYSFKVPPLVFTLKVRAYDKETEEPIGGASVQVVGSDGSSFEKQTNEKGMVTFKKDGIQRFIKKGTTYKIEVNKEKYLSASDQISTVGYEESRVFVSEAALQPTETEEGEKIAIEFPEVRYAYDKAELQVNDKVNSKDSLDYLYKVLQENPNIVIELQAHTDSRGGDAYNKRLSQRRAESCVEYLSSKGIPKERMVPKGYGENKPKIPMSEISKMKTEEEKEAAHQKNRRTEFIVLREDYVPKDKKGEDKKEGEGSDEEGKKNEGDGSGEGDSEE